jgi:hypothetical protein
MRIDIAGRSLPSPGSTIVRLLIRSGPAIGSSCRARSLVQAMIDDVSKPSIARQPRDIIQDLAAAARALLTDAGSEARIIRAIGLSIVGSGFTNPSRLPP